MYALPQSFFCKTVNWKENSLVQRLVARFCHHDHMCRVFTGVACRAEHGATWAGALESGTVALSVGLFEKCWQCFYSDHISMWIQLWCKGTRNTAKVRRQRGFIEIACDLHAKTKENCIPFLSWMSLVLRIAPWVSLWGSWLIIRLRLPFWVKSEGHPPWRPLRWVYPTGANKTVLQPASVTGQKRIQGL